MSEQETKQELEKVVAKPMVIDDGEFSMFLDTAKFDHAWRVGCMLSKSDLVPTQYKNKPENCVLAFNWATRLKIDPIQLMQKTYIVQGKPGMEAQLVIALVNARGPFKGPIQWKFQGDGENRQCSAYATHGVTNEVCSATVTWKMVKLEGWASKSGSKWMTMPDQMFMYRSATFLARLFCPEVILGFQTVDELRDIASTEPPADKKLPPSEAGARLMKTVQNEAEVSPAYIVDTETGERTLIDESLRNSIDNSGIGNFPKVEPEQVEERTPPKRRTRCSSCRELFNGEDLLRTTEGFLCATCTPPTELAGPEPTSDLGVAPEERYYCQGCGHVDADAGKTADGKLKCLACLATKVIDRGGFVE